MKTDLDQVKMRFEKTTI